MISNKFENYTNSPFIVIGKITHFHILNLDTCLSIDKSVKVRFVVCN